jgi:hypothetical protein
LIKCINKIPLLVTIIAFLILAGSSTSYSQDSNLDSLLHETLAYDSLLLEELAEDSLSIIELIDSLLNYDFRYSTLLIRLGYTSDIMYAGRDFGVRQYGFSAGVSYYHKTGIFGDLTSYWNSDIEPHINPTTLTLGYMGSITPKWGFIASYDHYIYSRNQNYEDVIYPLTNALNASTYLDLKHFSIGVDYAFLFGQETAHRIRPNMYGIIRIKNLGFIDEIDLFPSASMLIGNQTLYFLDENYSEAQSLLQTYGINNFSQFSQRRPRLAQYILANYVTYDERIENVFGIMNYSLSLPIMIRMNYFTISTGYYVNFPVALPGEEIDLNPNNYFNISLLYTIPFGLKKVK